ncbi:hypothetical protein AAZX31_19G148400 [Glycine max]|nr:hypothetical protein JHK86_053648 [Glycine max]KAG4916153.1 hypothetical protein JHK87_053710 [Glycine soja]KAG5083635.1 hypothetical protein JHK84_053673 [Glycine max]KAG5086403.1 hypothetical protein JHK82_053800 [Glycine max]KAH1194984.1 hypothetical protein GmHk_19G055622 [Glycine max]
MDFSYRRFLFTVVQLLLIMLNIFVASPESRVACRPLLLHRQWSREYGLHLQSLPNGPAPPSGGFRIHT